MYNNSIPEEVIQEVIRKTDIVESVGKHVQLTKRGKNYVGLCPFHSERTPSFNVNTEGQFYHCFGCGVGGNVIKFMMEIEGFSFPEAIVHLAEEVGITISWTKNAGAVKERSERGELMQAHELAAKFYHYVLKNTVHGKEAMQYLQNRGFSGRLVDQFRIGYAPPMQNSLTRFFAKREIPFSLLEKGGIITKHANNNEPVDRFRDRIIFPITDAQGRVIAFAGRALQDLQPKYLNSPETLLFNKSRLLYNLHLARAEIRKSKTIILFEGYVDVIKAWEAGIENGVATMGTSLSQEHVQLLRRYAREVIICYDGDDAGKVAAEKTIALLLPAGMNVRVAMIPDSLDPDDYVTKYGGQQFKREIIDGALTATTFRLAFSRSKYDLQKEQELLQYIRHALTIIADRPSPTEREHHLKELAAQYAYSLETLRQEMNEIRRMKQKSGGRRDNKPNSWNNIRNNNRSKIQMTGLMPAYYNAENYLLASMINNREVTIYVQEHLGDEFNVEVHAALAAYLYAFYAEYEQMDQSLLLTMLNNETLENSASKLFLSKSATDDISIIDKYIAVIKQHPILYTKLQMKKKEMKQAEKAGDFIKAAEIAKEIITLERSSKHQL